MDINYFDVAVIGILALFFLRGLVRGFVGEVAGVAGIVGGLWFAHTYSRELSYRLTFISDPMWRNIAAYVLVFVAVIMVVGLLARILQKILSFSFVSWADKLAGGLLGFIKGLIICSLLLLVAQRVIPDATFLQSSRVLPYLNTVIQQVRAHLPQDLVNKFNL